MNSNNKIYNLQSLKEILANAKKVGLFGGSFYPAHIGHLEISKYAIDFLELDYVIWLVSPQNPLKPKYKTNLQDRCLYAESIVDSPKIIVSDVEKEIKSKYTFDTIEFFCNTFPKISFTWMMGVDCLETFHLWEQYENFTNFVDIAIFDRPGYTNLMESSLAGKELLKNMNNRVIFCHNKKIDISSSAIRAKTND